MSNDKAAATWAPLTAPQNVAAMDAALEPEEPAEPMSLPDLVSEVIDIAEHLNQLAEAADDLRLAAVGEDRSADAIELHAIADSLSRAWSYARMAQTAAHALAAVQP